MILKKFGTISSILLFLTAIGLRLFVSQSITPIISGLIMVIFLILLVCEVLPIALVCIFVLGIMPILGVTPDFNSALTGFSNPVVFFILSSFGIASAIMKVPISKRILKFLLLKFGKNSKQLVMVFMISCALVSSIMSNVPSCAIFIAITSELLNLLPEIDRKKTGKTFMIGIPVASMIGGIMTPAGSSINLLALSILKSNTEVDVSFIKWMAIGVPIVLIILPIAWFIIIKVFPPTEIEKDKITKFGKDMNIPERLLPEEKRTLFIFGIIFSFWIASSWISSINIMVVSLIGCGIFCMPRIGVISVKNFLAEINWDTIFLVGTVLSLASVLCINGATNRIIEFFPSFGQSLFFILIGIALLTFILLIIIPVAPSLVAIITPVIIYVSIEANVNPALTVMICAMCAGNCYLLPIDTVCLISYSKGYYKMFEMPKATAAIQLSFVLISSILIYIIGGIIG